MFRGKHQRYKYENKENITFQAGIPISLTSHDDDDDGDDDDEDVDDGDDEKDNNDYCGLSSDVWRPRRRRGSAHKLVLAIVMIVLIMIAIVMISIITIATIMISIITIAIIMIAIIMIAIIMISIIMIARTECCPLYFLG